MNLSTSYTQWHPPWERQPCLSLVFWPPVLRWQDKYTGVLLLFPLLGVLVLRSAGSTASRCSASTLALGRISLISSVWTRLSTEAFGRISHIFCGGMFFWDLRRTVICAHSMLQLQYLPVVCLLEPRRFEKCTQSMLQLPWYVSANCAEWRSVYI